MKLFPPLFLSNFSHSPKTIAKLVEAQTKEGSLAPTLFFKPTIQQSRRHSSRMHKSPAENHPPNKEFYSRRRKTRVKVPILVMDKVLRFRTEPGTHEGPGEKRKGREGVGSSASNVMVMGTKSAWDGLSLFALPCFPLFFLIFLFPSSDIPWLFHFWPGSLSQTGFFRMGRRIFCCMPQT